MPGAANWMPLPGVFPNVGIKVRVWLILQQQPE